MRLLLCACLLLAARQCISQDASTSASGVSSGPTTSAPTNAPTTAAATTAAATAAPTAAPTGAPTTPAASTNQYEVDVPIKSHWNGGFQGECCIDITEELHGWTVHLKFDEPVNSLEVWVAEADGGTSLGSGTEFLLTHKPYNMDEHVGDRLCITFIGHGSGDINPTATAFIEGMTGGPMVTAKPGETLPTLGPGETRPPPPTTTLRPLPALTGDGVHDPDLTLNGGMNGGAFEGVFEFPIKEATMGWVANFTFNVPMKSLQLWDADVLTHSDDGYQWTIVNKGDRAGPGPGDVLKLKFRAQVDGSATPMGQATLYNMGFDPWTVPEAPNSDKSKYNYNDVIQKSILFYEAQRSGKLPDTNRIPWRGDSALGDKGSNGEDLTGGWYDAGDHVKFNFPMAWTTTTLTWGYLLWPEAYKAAGQEDYLLDCVRWPLEYLLKCHVAPEELYVQVGNAGSDHGYWGAPEQMTMARPAYKISASKPGSDVAMETAAAMSAGYLAFKDKDPTFADELLTHAKQLWDFGFKYPGKYSSSVSEAAGFYPSNNYTDEMCWGSLWLYQATNDSKYLAEAEKLWDPEPAWGMSWDEKTIGNQVLLYKLTGKDVYKQAVEGTYASWFPGGGGVQYTPKGLAWRLQWGSLRYSSNMAFGALVAADAGIMSKEYRHWAMCQLHYALGDTGFSYVIGVGDNYPHSPHHRSSSCPVLPARCGSYVMNSPAPNPHILYGALVGGPGNSDNYKDDRTNYVNNEVATDYNAGFTSAMAGLKDLWLNNVHPEQVGDATCPYSAMANPVVGRRRRHADP